MASIASSFTPARYARDPDSRYIDDGCDAASETRPLRCATDYGGAVGADDTDSSFDDAGGDKARRHSLPNPEASHIDAIAVAIDTDDGG